ncbi:uncharacterized protein RSE6_07969 [Rhynchosporium secalis]|uniref:Yeast cell wall synthesis Kre9/Knh1-like N-terminal domain-containing protein n=1 Tax=Rhynchosporium secalis TaxID=38038 RepID=A0A1E1ME80_RHYSE|nr:uncharacterized protein RSE6_07969 [Rhynchosporium secalis]
MQSSFVAAAAAAILALSSSVFAQTAGFDAITSPTQDQQVAAGSALDIVWQPTVEHKGPITIELLQGATPATLEVGQSIAASIDQTTGKFTWTVPKDLKSFTTYGFKITLDSTKTLAADKQIFQFSFPFHITGLGASTSSGSASATPYPTDGTNTVQLPTATGYPAQPMSSSASSSVGSSSENHTSTHVPVTTYVASAYPTGNVTLSTTHKPTASVSGSTTRSGTAAPSATTVTANSASTIARGGLAVAAGLVLAFAL